MPEKSWRCVAEIKLWCTFGFVLVCRIRENHSGHFVGKQACMDPRVQTTERRAHKNIRCRDARAVQECVKIPGDGLTGSGEGTGIAPPYASPVIPAGLREIGDLSLDGFPLQAWPISARLEHDCRSTRSRTEDI